MNWCIADLDFCHQNIIVLDNLPFADVEEMDRTFIENWNQKVQPNDDVYILGDVCFSGRSDTVSYLKQLGGILHLIQGNHDGKLVKSAECRGYFKTIEKMWFIRDGREKLVLCHFPLGESNGF